MLRAVKLTHQYDLDPLFEDLDLSLSRGDRVGLVGPNGTGKSTLMRLLAGIEQPVRGRVVRSAGLQVGWQSQEAADPGMTVAELVASGAPDLVAARERMTASEARLAAAGGGADELGAYGRAVEDFERHGGWAALARMDEVRSRLGVGTPAGIAGERRVRDLSGGEQSRVMLARLLVSAPDVLLLDEPTNHLDLAGKHWLRDHLASFPGAVLVVSHDRRFLDDVVTRVVELDGVRTELQDYPGCGYTGYRQERQRRWERLLLDHEAQEKYRQRLQEDIERTREHAHGVEVANPRNPGARRVARKVARKALSRERRLERQMRAATWIADPQTRPPLLVRVPPVADGDGEALLVEHEGVEVRAGGRLLLGPTPLRLQRGERVLITGENGAGKTSLLRTVIPMLPGVQLLPQTHDHLPADLTALEFFRSRVAAYVDEAERVLEGFLLDEDDRSRRLAELSVGQVRRLVLATMVNQPSQVLALDEPTNHLDFEALEVIEVALRAYRGTLLVVSHDEELADRIALTSRWHIAGGRLESAA